MDTQPVCTVVSFFPFPLMEEKPGLIPNRFPIPASDTFKPQVLKVTKAMHYVYLDETRGSLQVRDSPDEVARSIVEDFCNAQLGLGEGASPGIFWVNGDFTADEIEKKFPQEVVAVKVKQLKWFQAICRIADDDWNKYHQHNVVSDFQRKAAHLIGWKPEEHAWMNARGLENSIKCPNCTKVLDGSVISCPDCRCIINKEAYEKLTFAK
jgi:hypothetical protein